MIWYSIRTLWYAISMLCYEILNKKCFRNIYAPLSAKFKITTYMYKAWLQPCTKFGIDQVKGSKDIEQTAHWARKSGLTLTFEHVT